MRAGVLCFVFTVLAIAVIRNSSEADEFQQTAYMARVHGFFLIATGAGEKPCDFADGKLLNDAKFVLNTANIDFAELGDANANYGDWPILSIYAQSLKVSYGCIWTLDVSVRASQSGATILGLPYGGSVQIWNSTAFGTSPGDGLTAYVSDAAQDFLKEIVNDMHAARKKFTK